MKGFRFWATACAIALALSLTGGRRVWCEPDDELGGGEKKDPAPGGQAPPSPSDELGGGEHTDPPAKPPMDPPKEAPKDPPAEPPKDPPADPPPADPPPTDPAAKPPDGGSVDEELARKEAAKKEENRIKALLADFNKRMHKDNPQEQMSALTDISSVKHPLVAEALVPWIQPTIDPRVRNLALECAKSQCCPEMGRAAASLLEKNGADIKYCRALVVIMGRSKDKAQIAKLRTMLKSKDWSLELQKEAIAVLGQSGSRDVIPEFIRMYKEFENPHLPEKEIPRRAALQKLVEDALDQLSGTHMMNGKGWDLWWKDNEKTFGKPKEGEAPKDGGTPK